MANPSVQWYLSLLSYFFVFPTCIWNIENAPIGILLFLFLFLKDHLLFSVLKYTSTLRSEFEMSLSELKLPWFWCFGLFKLQSPFVLVCGFIWEIIILPLLHTWNGKILLSQGSQIQGGSSPKVVFLPQGNILTDGLLIRYSCHIH